jgi:hypothetical protein
MIIMIHADRNLDYTVHQTRQKFLHAKMPETLFVVTIKIVMIVLNLSTVMPY